MLRLPFVARPASRYIPTSVRCTRYESTVQSTPTPEPAPSITQNAPTTENISPDSKNGEPEPGHGRRRKNRKLATMSPTPSAQIELDWKAIGLKYDPTTLPLQQTLDPNDREFTEEEYAATLIHGRSVHEPFYHPRTHDIPVASIHFRSHHVKLLKFFTHFASHAAASLGIPISKVASLPTQRTLWTVLRSPFAHKKSQENFDRKVHKRAIKAWDADSEVVERWVAYLQKHALPGVGMRVTTWQRIPVGVDATSGLVKDDTRENLSTEAPSKILELGQKIVAEEGTVSAKY